MSLERIQSIVIQDQGRNSMVQGHHRKELLI